ncbi:MAG: enoyl-CoA hydratase-related protein [Pseudomonadota bacterium]
MTTQTLTYALTDGVAEIRLNRPDRMNALTTTMRREIAEALRQGADEARAVLLTGNGPGFCAGQDLMDAGGFDDLDLEKTLLEEYKPMLDALRECPVPTVCAVNGAAAGAGANLALAADIVIAAKSATFLQAFARIGLVPDAGGTYMLPRRIGMARALGHCLLADKITATQARDWGLIWDVVADETLDTHAHGIAKRLAAGPTLAYRMIKDALRQSEANDWDTQFALEAELQGKAGKSADFVEGVTAFLQKRPAAYTGR